jgi:hypothetical protein
MQNILCSSMSEKSLKFILTRTMLFLKIEEKNLYIGYCHVETCSDYILINMGFLKFKHRHSKHVLDFGYSIFDSKSQE